jgi:hypothetical protein
MLHRRRAIAEVNSKWSCIWPAKGKSRDAWLDIAKMIQATPLGIIPGFMRVGVRRVTGGES